MGSVCGVARVRKRGAQLQPQPCQKVGCSNSCAPVVRCFIRLDTKHKVGFGLFFHTRPESPNVPCKYFDVILEHTRKHTQWWTNGVVVVFQISPPAYSYFLSCLRRFPYTV
jgi:hypothetical protein